MKKAALCILLIMSSYAKAATIEFGEGTTIYVKEQVAKILELLPSNYLDKNEGSIFLNVGVTKGSKLGTDLCKSEADVIFATTLKKKKNHIITLSQDLVNLAQMNKVAFDCSHRTFERVMQASIFHELTHVKDNSEKISTDSDFQRIVGVRHLSSSGKTKVLNQNTSNSPDAYEFKNFEESLAVNVEYLRPMTLQNS